MAEPENTTDPLAKVDPAVVTADPDPNEMIGNVKFSDLDPTTQAHIKGIRESDKAKRLKLDELNKKLSDIEAANKAKEQEAQTERERVLKEQGDFKKLYEATQPQIAELTTAKAELAEMTAFINTTLEARLKAIPAAKKTIVEALPPMTALAKLTWLEKNAALLSAPVAPNLDAGATGNQATVVDPAFKAQTEQQYRNRF